MDKEYILYCDESAKTGRYFSNFYGGVMIGSSQYMRIVSFLENEKKKLNLQGEVKWSKVTENYLEKYKTLMHSFFSEIKMSNLRVRIMYRQNAYAPDDLTLEDLKNEFFKLYYQFIKHAFGLEHANLQLPVKLRIYFDDFPENQEAASRFKGFLLHGLNKNKNIRRSNILLSEEDVAEVNSHEHVLLQCLDIVLGAMHFRLNNKHLEKVPGSNTLAKRTVAKEKLYKAILEEIKSIKPDMDWFNIGVTTPISNFEERWTEAYLHWSFKPKSYTFRRDLTKNPQLAYKTSDA